jgi:uncharacterized OB-fold protein
MSEPSDPLQKPVPHEIPDERPYWEATKRHELALQHCGHCDKLIHPPRPGCPHCGGDETDWVTLGREISGRVYSLVTVHRAFDPSFADDVPYLVALCDVDQAPGVRLVANVLGADEGFEIGSRVEMLWEDRNEESTVPQWKAVD